MTDNTADWSWVPQREWEWQEGTMLCGVHTHEGQLVWWSRPFGPTGYMFENAAVQAFPDFLASGPRVSAPTQVVDKLSALLQRLRTG
ncbi:MAG: hypothetical protein ACT4QE_24885 [Anaerolineales bacterium]